MVKALQVLPGLWELEVPEALAHNTAGEAVAVDTSEAVAVAQTQTCAAQTPEAEAEALHILIQR